MSVLHSDSPRTSFALLGGLFTRFNLEYFTGISWWQYAATMAATPIAYDQCMGTLNICLEMRTESSHVSEAKGLDAWSYVQDPTYWTVHTSSVPGFLCL